MKKGYSVKGHHVIQCDTKNEYSHDPNESQCEEGPFPDPYLESDSLRNSPFRSGQDKHLIPFKD